MNGRSAAVEALWPPFEEMNAAAQPELDHNRAVGLHDYLMVARLCPKGEAI